MRYRVIPSPDAEADIDSAVRWYQRIDPNLAFRFTSEMRAIQRRIKHTPYQFPLVKGGIRQALLRHFPFYIFYTLNEDLATIIAVVHQRRSDTAWIDRRNGRN